MTSYRALPNSANDRDGNNKHNPSTNPINSAAGPLNEHSEGDSYKAVVAPSLLVVHLAIIAAQVSFGGGSVIGSLGMPDTNPVLFAFIREGTAGPLLCLLAYIIDRKLPNLRQDWLLFIKPGLALYINQLTFIVGLKISTSILASSWQPSQGILAVVFGYCLGVETHIDIFKIMGILIGTGGALFMIIYGDQSGDASSLTVWNTIGGSVMFFLNCSATVLYLIFAKPVLQKYPSSTVTGYCYLVATVLMSITAMVVALSPTVLHFLCDDCNGPWEVPTVTIYALIYWVLMQSILSYCLMTWANKYADPSVNLAYTVLQPLTAEIASELLLLFKVVPNCDSLAPGSDQACLYGPSWADLGSIGIAIGLYFVIYSDRKKRAEDKLRGEMQDHMVHAEDDLHHRHADY